MQLFQLWAVWFAGVKMTSAFNDVKNRPVSKVMTLLKDMMAQLNKEAEEDEEVYEAMGCWCETNTREKSKSIKDAEQSIADSTSAIEEHTAISSRLNTEIKQLESEVAHNNRALDQATALRAKQLAEFNAEEKDMIQSISALKSAVVVIGKKAAAESALMQDTSTAMDVAVLLDDQMRRHKAILGDSLSPEQRMIIKKFAKSPDAFLQSSQPAAGEVFGVLKQMKETFQANLASSQKEESRNQQAYEDLKAAKKEEIDAGQSLLDTKYVELGTNDEKNACAKENLADTQKVLEADTAFLVSVKQQCATLDQQYEERTKSRQDEIQATSKALAFLSSDDARDMFSRTLNFAQIRMHSEHRINMYGKLMSLANKFNDPRLSTLATQAKLDAFKKVKAAVNNMISSLTKEKEDEIKHKDFCVTELNSNERDIELKERDKSGLKAKIDDLLSTIDELDKAMEVIKSEIAEMHTQMKRAGEDREKENKNFQMEVSDQRATQKLLNAALGVLKGFYNKAALVQNVNLNKKQPDDNSAPPQFKPMKRNAASGGVMGMLQQIIHDAKMMEKEAIQGEDQAQKAYEAFVKDTNFSIEQKSRDLVNKAEEKGKTEQEKVETKKELSSVMGELESLYSANADLHKSCDFILKNFQLRQTARDEEIQALRDALAMFSGASPGTLFLQQK
jgi:hypothetical protein